MSVLWSIANAVLDLIDQGGAVLWVIFATCLLLWCTDPGALVVCAHHLAGARSALCCPVAAPRRPYSPGARRKSARP
jgi:hypothetical protein